MKKIIIIILFLLFSISYPLKRNNIKIKYSKKTIIKTRVFSAILFSLATINYQIYKNNNKSLFKYSAISLYSSGGLAFLITIPLGD